MYVYFTPMKYRTTTDFYIKELFRITVGKFIGDYNLYNWGC